MKATKNGHYEIARCLLQAGADPCLKSPQGGVSLESRSAAPVVSLVNKHRQRIESSVDACIRSHVNELGLVLHGSPIFPLKFHNIREGALLHTNFNCDLESIPPNQGVVLFSVHGLTGSNMSIKCRLRGPCHVHAVTINNGVMDPVMPTKEPNKFSHFMTNLIWRDGLNSLRVFLSQDGTSNEKIYLTAYLVGISGA
ncbi:M-phase phosphoprotein 8-like [Ciona intestinalis]